MYDLSLTITEAILRNCRNYSPMGTSKQSRKDNRKHGITISRPRRLWVAPWVPHLVWDCRAPTENEFNT